MSARPKEAHPSAAAGSERPPPTEPDPALLRLLVCPVTRGPLEYDSAAQELISRRAGLAYPIRDGIPIMLQDEARTLP